MAIGHMSEVLQELRRTVLRDDVALPDGQLLENYVSQRVEWAFAALVRRHGPMVWGVCRRLLGDRHDAEDAFQATFLVLVRRAASIFPRQMVGNWLYGVAYQTALKARVVGTKRKLRERQVVELPEPVAAEPDRWLDLRPVLDEELNRLSAKYRAVIALCELEGMTRKEASRQLSVPEGTVAGRLARARTMLAKRLARRGVVLSASALAALLAQNASAAVPDSLLSSTIKAASLWALGHAAAISINVTSITEGVLRTMMLTKIKTAGLILAVAVVALGAGASSLRQHLLAQPTVSVRAADEKASKADSSSDKKDDSKSSNDGSKGSKSDGGKKPPADDQTGGVVESVDTAKSTISLKTKGEGEKTYALAKDAAVELDGKAAKLGDVPAGASALLHLTPVVHSLAVTGQEVSGTVGGVDTAKSTVTISRKGDLTFDVAKDAKIFVDGKAAKLSDVKDDMPVDVRLGANKKTVLSIWAGAMERTGGHVKSVDAGKSTITLETKGEKGLEEKSFTVAKDAAIEVDSKPVKLADVPEKAFVHVKLAKDGTTALDVQATARPMVSGELSAVEKNVLTMVDAKGQKRSFPLPVDADISIDGKSGKLADVTAGTSVAVYLTSIVNRVEATKAKKVDKE